MQEPTIPDIDHTTYSQDETYESRFVLVWRFIKKHWLALSITAFVITAIIVAFFAIPVISIGKLKIVNADASVTLKAGDTVNLKASNVSATVGGFVVDTCPIKGGCYGTDVAAVEYILTVGSQKYATSSTASAPKTDYRIETVTSDYKTYVTIKIVKQDGSN